MQKLIKRLSVWAVIVAAILMIPVTLHWPWTGGDFVFAIVVLYGSAVVFETVSRKMSGSVYRWAVGVAVASSLVLVWINGAAGIIGHEGTIPTMIFPGVVLVGIIGAIISRLRPLGLSRTLFTMAIVQALIPVVALIFWNSKVHETPGVVGVFLMCWFFAGLFMISSMLFRKASQVNESRLSL